MNVSSRALARYGLMVVRTAFFSLIVWAVLFAWFRRSAPLLPESSFTVDVGFFHLSAISPSGRHAVVKYHPDDPTQNTSRNSVAVWDLEAKRCVARFPYSLACNRTRSPFSFSPDGSYFAALLVRLSDEILARARHGRSNLPDPSLQSPTILMVLNLKTERVEEYPLWPDFGVETGSDRNSWMDYSVVPSVDGTRVWIQGESNHDVWQMIIDPAARRTLWSQRGPMNGAGGFWTAREPGFSPDGRLAACVARPERRADGEVLYLIDLAAGRPIHAWPILGEHFRPVVQFSPDGLTVALGGTPLVRAGEATSTEVHDVVTHQTLERFAGEGMPMFSWDGRLFATVAGYGENAASIEVVIRRTADWSVAWRREIPAVRASGWSATRDPVRPFLLRGERGTPAWAPAKYAVFDPRTGAEVCPERLPAVASGWSHLLPDGRRWLDHEGADLAVYSLDGPVDNRPPARLAICCSAPIVGCLLLWPRSRRWIAGIDEEEGE